MAGIVADDDLLAQTPAPLTGAARIGEELLALDGGMREGLPHLDGYKSHVRGMRQRRPTVEALKRAVAAGGKIDGREWSSVAAYALHGDEVHHAGLRLHAAGRDLGQRAIDQRRHEVSHRMTPTGGKGRLRIEDAPGRRRHLHRRYRPGTVGNVG